MRIKISVLILSSAVFAQSLACWKGSIAQTQPETNSVVGASGQGAGAQKPIESAGVGLVSMVRLLANPEEFNGKSVQLIGYVHLEFEGNGVYLSEHDYRYGLDKNGLWLSIPTSDTKKYKTMNDTYAVVEGTFNAESKGHLGFFSGSIENITMFKTWAKARR